LNALVHQKRSETAVQERSLEEDRERRSTVELEHEKSVQRGERLQDQIKALEERKSGLGAEKTRTLEDLERNKGERDTRTRQLASIELEKETVVNQIQSTSAILSEMTERRTAEDRMVEQFRQQQFEAVGREARIRNEITSRKETIARITAHMERLEREEADARTEAAAVETRLNAA